MRIGVDYRMLSAGRVTVNRGMGRYTQQQLREVLRLDSENEYVLLAREDGDVGAILPEIRTAPNVSLALMPQRTATVDELNEPANLLRSAEDYQAWVAAQRLDLYHAATPFLITDVVLSRFDVCPYVVTHYDLIPLIFSDRYFPPRGGEKHRERYARTLGMIRGADRFIAISEFVRREAVQYLGVPPSRIDVAYPVADPCFRPLAEEQREALIRDLRRRLGFAGEFLLCVSHLHHAKNLPCLLSGYARLAPALRRRFPLVVTCDVRPVDRVTLERWVARHGIEEDVVFTGFVSDQELVGLYNSAALVVHPSRYEGFGLPVLEALRCGAPVVTTTSASLPEVAGAAAVLVDAERPQAFTAVLADLLADPARRREMRARALVRAAAFCDEALGRATLACYRRALDEAAAPRPRRPRIALWTPLPPQRSGVADYSAELLREMAQWAADQAVLEERFARSC